MSRIARYAVSEKVTVLVGSKAGEHAHVEHVVWSERDRLSTNSPARQ
jgi:hypothetical protein